MTPHHPVLYLNGGGGDVRVASAQLVLTLRHLGERLAHGVQVDVRIVRDRQTQDVIAPDVTEKKTRKNIVKWTLQLLLERKVRKHDALWVHEGGGVFGPRFLLFVEQSVRSVE